MIIKTQIGNGHQQSIYLVEGLILAEEVNPETPGHPCMIIGVILYGKLMIARAYFYSPEEREKLCFNDVSWFAPTAELLPMQYRSRKEDIIQSFKIIKVFCTPI